MGAKAGLSVAKLRNDIVDDTGFKTGFCGGGFIVFRLLPPADLRVEALYAERGGLYDVIVTDDFGNAIGAGVQRYRLGYLELPLLACWRMPTQGNIQPGVTIGPALALKLSSRLQTVLDPEQDDPPESTRDLDSIAAADAALVFGLGFLVDLGQIDLTFDARYNWGLTNINQASGPEAAEIKNSAFTILAGVCF